METTDDFQIKHATSRHRLLFIHQTSWQRRLLERYGNDLSLLDATYKTTRYSLPLFLLVVKTNVDYQVAASFIVQDEISDSIMEALSIISCWCPDWNPCYFMVNNSHEEITAINFLFPGNWF